MQSTNRLGLIVAVVSSIAVLLVFGVTVGVRALLAPKQERISHTPIASPETTLKPQAEAADRDRDGLADHLEVIYRTSPDNPDTDGDGTNDGDEITLLRNPTKPGPDDTLENLTEDGILDTTTYTGKYLALLPTQASREDILSRERIEAFINSEQQELLPTIDPSTITTSDATGETAISAYLGEISASHNDDLTAISNDDITEAFRASSTSQTSEDLTVIANQLESNLDILKAVEPPAETLQLHQTLLSASQALLTNVRLLENMRTDFVGGLIGAKNIEDLGPVFQGIAQKITELETKYGLE